MISYLDAFDPIYAPRDLARLASREIVPALLNHLSAHGIDLSVSDSLNAVVRMNELSGGKMGVFQPFDPRYQKQDRFIDILVAEKDGKQVGTIGTVGLWLEGTLRERMESLELFYIDPEKHDEYYVTNADRSVEIKDCLIAMSGAGFLMPSERGAGIYAAMSRLHFLRVLTHREWTWNVGLATDETSFRKGFSTYGFNSAEPYVLRSGEKYNDLLLLSAPRSWARHSLLRAELADLSIPVGLPRLDNSRAPRS